jgi:putative Mn2+ efflux pump MntP
LGRNRCPILFVFVFSLDGLLKPEYLSQPISYLELGANGWIQSANFIVLGLLLIVFAFGLTQKANLPIKKVPMLISTVLLLLVGLAFINDGMFVPAAPIESPNIIHAVLHGIGFEVIFLSLPIAYLLIGWQLRKIASWRIYGWYSIVSAFITVIPALFVIVSSFAPASSGAQSPSFVGLINRIFVIEALAWYVVTGVHMLTLIKRNR